MRVEICDYCGNTTNVTTWATVYLQVAGAAIFNHAARPIGRPQACAGCVKRLSDAMRSAVAGVCTSFQPLDIKVGVGINQREG